MFSTKRSRVRALAGVGMAGVFVAVGAVAYDASAAQAPSDSRAVSIPLINEAIKPPAGSKPVGAYVVTKGTQTYACTAAGTWDTTKSTPEAQLIGTGGKIHHFAGPTWQSLRDGSAVTATKEAGVDRAGTIQELRLRVTSHTGSGVLSNADYINRLFTSGGVAPASGCTAGETVSVPYGAVYVFWDAPAA